MPTCPHCHSHAVVPRTNGKDTASTIGAAIGGICGAVSVLRTAPLAQTTQAVITAVGAAASVLASAALAGIAGGAMGAEVGANVGNALDERVLDNYHCTSCGSTFRKTVFVVDAAP